jgi:hypothetical protein
MGGFKWKIYAPNKQSAYYSDDTTTRQDRLIKCIRKESNSLETVDEGLEHSEQNVYTDYADPRRTEWIVKIQPALKKAKLEILVRFCKNKLSRREIIELRAGRKKPHRKTQELRVAVVKRPDVI